LRKIRDKKLITASYLNHRFRTLSSISRSWYHQPSSICWPISLSKELTSFRIPMEKRLWVLQTRWTFHYVRISIFSMVFFWYYIELSDYMEILRYRKTLFG